MALTFINIYNEVAEQAWSMYDADVESVEDFESGLKSSINKALGELWCSYDFPFRVKEYTITTQDTNSYDMPTGNIYKKSVNNKQTYSVRLVGKGYLEYSDAIDSSELESGTPTKFQVYNDKILLDCIPDDTYSIIVEYVDLAIGEDDFGDKLYELVNDEDEISVPEKFEKIFKNALITKAMLYAIASKEDENYAGYLEQYENAYKTLIKYSMGIDVDKRVII